MLVMPKDMGIALFAATLAENPNHDTKASMEMRILPQQEKSINYIAEPLEFRDRNERTLF